MLFAALFASAAWPLLFAAAPPLLEAVPVAAMGVLFQVRFRAEDPRHRAAQWLALAASGWALGVQSRLLSPATAALLRAVLLPCVWGGVTRASLEEGVRPQLVASRHALASRAWLVVLVAHCVLQGTAAPATLLVFGFGWVTFACYAGPPVPA